MINKIKEALDKRASKIQFSEEDHTYWVGAEQYTSVSETLAFYNSSMDDIPNMDYYSDRGTRVHKVLEKIANKQKVSVKDDELEFVNKGYEYLKEQLSNGWEILATEQIMYDIPKRVAGTVDLLLIRKTVKDYATFILPHLSNEDNEVWEIKVVDWKTGPLKMQDYGQIGLYEFLLRKSLGKRLMENIEITTELVSLKS